MRHRYSNALVLGAGRSGVAAARLLNSEGCRVTLVDAGEGAPQIAAAVDLRREGVETLLGVKTLPAGSFDVAVFSPGIPADAAWACELESRGIPAMPELDLGFARCNMPVVAVTGTNGKSTLVKLCAEIFQQAGLRAVPAGNYGVPLSEVVLSGVPLDWVVVEASSFQLEKSRWFHPRVAVLLNLYPNHLDRHGTFEKYRNAKCRLFACMDEQDQAVVFEENAPEIRVGLVRMAPDSAARMKWRTFGLSKSADFRYSEHNIVQMCCAGRSVNISGSVFDNEVLGLSAAAAAAVAEACGCAESCVERAIAGFEPLAHRMQEVHCIGDVVFVDDSKATTLTALHAALRMSKRPIRLIAGGLLKEYDLDCVKEALRTKVKSVYLIGKAAGPMRLAWQDVVPCHICGVLDQAVTRAWAEAQPGEMVLLATGCASFDQFTGFAERGKKFTEQVRRLDEKK